MSGSTSWRNDIRAVIVAALASVVLLALACSQVWPLTVDVGGNDRRFVDNFNAPETMGETSIRWTNGNSRLALPRPLDGSPAILSLRMVNARPENQPAPQITLVVDGRATPAFEVARGINGLRNYQVLVAPGTALRWSLPVELRSDAILLPEDPRPLGVMLDRAQITPTSTLPSLWLVCWAALLGALAYGFPRSFGISAQRALEVALLLALLIALGIVARPLEVLPFVQRIGALLGLGTAGVLFAQFLAPPVETTDDKQTPHPGPPHTRGERRERSIVLRGPSLPIYMAIAWWLGPAYQLTMTLDGAASVTPAPATSWIGGALLAGLIVLIGWALLRHDQSVLTRGALVLFVTAALAHSAYLLWFGFHRSAPDFWILFRGARDWARGGSLYDLVAVSTNHFGHVFKVPPFYGMLFVPFVFKDGLQILFFHRVINTLLIALTFVLWYRMWGIRLLSAVGLGTLLLLNFYPFVGTLALGQIDLALLILLTGALWALRRNHAAIAGALVALGTLFKLYPVLLLGFFVVKRQWNALLGFLVGMVVFNGIAIAVMGWDMHRVYVTEVLPRISGTTAWVENQTIAGFITRFVDTPREADIFTNHTLALFANVLSLLVIGAACLLAVRPAGRQSGSYALQYSLFPLVMVLAVPTAWMHYETLLFLPFATLLLRWHNQELPLTRVIVAAMSFGLIAYGNQWSFYDGTVMGVLTIIGISSKFYGMLLLGGLLVGELVRERAPLLRRTTLIQRPVAR